jgi:pSer/pThr/pTyr-binding forkhead associated (FHA) protein
MVEGHGEITAKESPKNQNVLAGFLVSFSKTEIGEYWTLREGNNSLGSSHSSDILLNEKHVSEKHANINISKDSANNCWKFQLVDLSSTNGTEQNGNRLPIYSGTEIKNQDTLKIGEYTLMLFITDKFANNLSKSEKLQVAAPAVDYDSRGFFSSNNDATKAGY